MALQHSDGFDSHAAGTPTLSDGDPGWTGQLAVSISAGNGKFSGNCLRLAAATAGYAAFSNTGARPAFAGYFKTGTFGGTVEANLLQTAAGQKLLTVNQAGDLKVYDGGGTLRITALAALPAGAYKWLEVDYLAAGINLYADGLAVGSYTGAYTAPATTLRLLGNAAVANVPILDVDDFLAWDDTGSYFNTFNLSPRRIQLLRPNAAGDSTAWTPASGANWAAADSASWAGGVGVSATVNGLKDLYAATDLAAVPGVIDAVVVKTKTQNLGTDPASIQHVVKETASGLEVSGATQVAPMTVAPLRSVFYQNPNALAWTGAQINTAQFGQTSVI